MTRISEKRDVQDQLINYLVGIGWTFIPRHDLPAWRDDDETEPFLVDVLREQVAALNEWPADDERIDEVVRRLRLLPANLEGNEQFLRALRGGWTAYDREQQREFNVTLVDVDAPERNVYHFTEEMRFVDRDTGRLDMVLFVNGLPVLFIENKSPKAEDPGDEGFKDVQHYTRIIPEFVKYPIPFAICARQLEYGATWNPSLTAFYTWKVDGQAHGLERLSKSFLDREMVLRLLRDYALFYRIDDAIHKFLLRPHQMRTVEKIVARVLAGLDDLRAPDTGLEWHTQGSGKTLTMIVAAHLLRRQPEMQNPTLLIVVDRLELEGQMLLNLEAFGFPAVARAESKSHLRKLLRDDYRGLIVTTIHKFDRMPADVNPRRNIVILIDEAHRSQEGDLGIYMRAALPNAFQFGFTGTPIDRGKIGKGTFELYGRHDDTGYHDKYSINESIEDRTTVPLYYTLAPTDIWVDKLQLETRFAEELDRFMAEVDAEGAATQEALSRILQKADKLLAVLKAPARLEAIAAHIAEHFQANVLPLGFKAMVVTPDREACALYKDALDRFLPPEWSVVVYSENPKKDPDFMRQHYLDEDEEKRIRKAFRDPDSDPKILIVTEKLLTGYDAPVAYCMYLDKPLKDHTLLQAIARINRPFTEQKKSGLVVDYIGIFENLQRALSFDTASITRGLINLEELKRRFVDLLEQAYEAVEPIQPQNVDGRVDRITEHFFEPEPREAFFRLFKELQMAYEVLSPDAFLRPYIDDYALITDIYLTAYNTFDPKARQQRLERDLLRKTDALIREHVSSGPVAEPLPLYPINRNIADVVRADDVPNQVKVINLHRSLIAHIQQAGEAQPFLLSIAEEVEQVIELLRQRQIGVETALAELQEKAEKVVQTEDERASSPLDNLAFSLRMVLRASDLTALDDEGIDVLAENLSAYLRDHEGWRYNEGLKRQVRLEIYGCLLPHIHPFDASQANAIVDNLLKMQRITT
jgi:type I restriction enzyme R subunit